MIGNVGNVFLLNLACFIPLIFLFCTCLYGLFSLRLSGFYSMHDNKHTDSISLLYLSSFMCRIGFPLCLNFLQIIKLKNTNTALEEFMGLADIIPVFGTSFTLFYPTILIVFCLFNLLDVYGKCLNIFGFPTFGFNNQQNDDKIEEGVDTLNKSIIYCLCFSENCS